MAPVCANLGSLIAMSPLLQEWTTRGRVLLVTAAPKESRAVLEALGCSAAPELWRLVEINHRFDLLETGVGKANAAGATARRLDPSRHAAVVNLGVAGALPDSPCAVGECVVATESVFGDEGLDTPDGFVTAAAIGFPLTLGEGMGVRPDPDLFAALRGSADHAGVIATVSTCASTDARARGVRSRTGAVAEAMEGAAVGAAVERVNHCESGSIDFAEFRAISNTTGDRGAQRWDLNAALERLRRAVLAW